MGQGREELYQKLCFSHSFCPLASGALLLPGEGVVSAPELLVQGTESGSEKKKQLFPGPFQSFAASLWLQTRFRHIQDPGRPGLGLLAQGTARRSFAFS